MKEIHLTKGLIALVDESDFEWISDFKWCASNGAAIRSIGIKVDGKWRSRSILMHREIMQCPESLEVDHIDGNRLNNQRSNLRICTHSDNQKNRRKKCASSSKYRGVSFVPRTNRWLGRVESNGKLVLNHLFRTEIEAAQACNFAYIRHHGQFACLNKL